MSEASCDPTEITLYREPHSDHFGTWQDRMFQTGTGERKGIGIDVAGTVYVLPLKKWHELASSAMPIKSALEGENK